MKTYFKIITWMYMFAGIVAAALTVFFQVNGKRDEAIYCLVCVFICGLMLGLRTWLKKRMIRLEEHMKTKHEEKMREQKTMKQK